MKDYVLRYSAPAAQTDSGWQHEVLPIGNGRLGACVFGATACEWVQFNEKTLWSGGPSATRPDYCGGNVPGSVKYLDEMREALRKNRQGEVKQLAKKLVGLEEGYGNYLDFGRIELNFGHKDVQNYKRSLSLTDGVARVSYDCEGTRFRREFFAGFSHNVVAAKLSADKSFGFELSFCPAQNDVKIDYQENSIKALGTVADNGLKFYFSLTFATDGKVAVGKDCLQISQATECVFAFSATTDYKNDYPNYRGELKVDETDKAAVAAVAEYEVLKQATKAYISGLMLRNTVDIGGVDSGSDTPTMLAEYRKDQTTAASRFLEETVYQYGRYLLISSSIKGTLPANLQGIWNNSNTPAWACDYHLNVNLQMCYWHAYTSNLAELALPMIDYMKGLVAPGRVTAEYYHGIKTDSEHPANGWVAHTQNTPFGFTCPGWYFYWGWSPASSSWMMQNCMDYYYFTGDLEVLRDDVYPMLKENCMFWLQNLVYNKEEDRYESTPSFSPEQGPISVGNTYEQELIYMLFSDAERAAKVLGDEGFIVKLKAVKEKLKPLHVGRWGQIKEWYEEDKWYRFKCFRKLGYLMRRSYPGHRHCSHLIGLYPGLDIGGDKKLAAAAKVSLIDRGAVGPGLDDSGWGKANKVCLWARLGDATHAYAQLSNFLATKFADNLWDMHPPYQMDGNCGYTAAVTEMLLFSDHTHLKLLPACPAAWSDGEVVGLRARGGYSVDFKWVGGRVVNYRVSAKVAGTVKIIVNGIEETAEVQAL